MPTSSKPKPRKHRRLNRDTAILVAPSPIHGVGLFARQAIPEGAPVNLWTPRDWRFYKESQVRKGTKLYEMCKRFCIRTRGGYFGPAKFASMSIAWLINHSDTPNLAGRGFHYHALRKIKKGEELTINYSALDDFYDNLLV